MHVVECRQSLLKKIFVYIYTKYFQPKLKTSMKKYSAFRYSDSFVLLDKVNVFPLIAAVYADKISA